MFNLCQMVTQAARDRPEKTALIDGEEHWSYADLDRATSVVAQKLLDSDLRAGDRVGLQLANGASFVIAYFAILRAGMVVVPFNPMAVEREISHILERAECRAVFTSRDNLEDVIQADVARRVSLIIADGEIGRDELDQPAYRRHGKGLHIVGFDEVVSADHECVSLALVSENDTAVVIFTSGTTGEPKAAALTHFNLWMSCTALASRSEPKSSDVVLACLPLFHVYGMSGTLNVSIAWGMTLVISRDARAERVMELIDRYEVTRFSGVPTMLTDMVARGAGSHELGSVQRVTVGGASLPAGILEEFEAMFPHATLLEGYGSSETTGSICVNPSRERRKLTSVGTPSWGTEARVVDASGNTIGDGGVGELQFRGPTVFAGYLGDPRATEAAFTEGWFKSGDLARMDDDGFIYIVDRLKSLIIRAGYNVYPSEVEHVLLQHPQVSEALVIGVEDLRVGQEVGAVVAVRRGASVQVQDILEFAGLRLSRYKVPRVVRLVEEIPKTSTGKARRDKAALLFADGD